MSSGFSSPFRCEKRGATVRELFKAELTGGGESLAAVLVVQVVVLRREEVYDSHTTKSVASASRLL